MMGPMAAGAAAGGIGGALAAGLASAKHGLFGGPSHSGHSGHKPSSSPIPIGGKYAGLAAGVGAAALGAAVLHKANPMKKMKKLYKHKHKGPKFFKHKSFKWKHKGWSSGSSSD
jgi:hypothetical protein